MAIAVVWASPNTDGLTAACKDACIKGIRTAGGDCDIIHLNSAVIERCHVCGSGKGLCASGKCAINDDMPQIYERLHSAEAVIWITPVYWHEPSEPFNALISRIRRSDPLVNHYLQDKMTVIIAVAGKSGNGAIKSLHLMEDAMYDMKLKVCDRIAVTQFSKEYKMETVENAARSLCAAVHA